VARIKKIAQNGRVRGATTRVGRGLVGCGLGLGDVLGSGVVGRQRHEGLVRLWSKGREGSGGHVDGGGKDPTAARMAVGG